MAVIVQVVDEATPGAPTPGLALDLLVDTLTVREVIRARVYQEVSEYNARRHTVFRGLVQPEGAERVLNGYRLAPGRLVDWERQFARALSAFAGNGFLLFLDGRQLTDLDAVVTLTPASELSFLKLTPLVGG